MFTSFGFAAWPRVGAGSGTIDRIGNARSRCIAANRQALRDLSQRIFGTAFCAFHTEDTLRAVCSLSGVVRNVDVHRTDLFAFAARHTFVFVALDPENGEITHRLQKHGDRADILAESAVVFE